MLVGPTGGGKTVVLNTLVKAQTTMAMPTKCVTLNPKVIFYILTACFSCLTTPMLMQHFLLSFSFHP